MKKFLLFLILIFPFITINAISVVDGPTFPNIPISDENQYFLIANFRNSNGQYNTTNLLTFDYNYHVIVWNYSSTDTYNVLLFYRNLEVLDTYPSGNVTDDIVIYKNNSYYHYYNKVTINSTNSFHAYVLSSNNEAWLSDNSTTPAFLILLSKNTYNNGFFYINRDYVYFNGTYSDNNQINVPSTDFVKYNVTFHLNGGTAVYHSTDHIGADIIYTNTFTKSFLNNYDLSDFEEDLTIDNDISSFNGWYYDQALTQPYNLQDPLTSDIDLYASYYYNSVSDIIRNITFDQYTFPDDKEYAVISIENNFSLGLYIGLGFNFQNLAIYSYNIQDQVFSDMAILKLSSIGSLENIYYYHMSQFTNDTARVLVIDKADLIQLNSSNDLDHYYTFYTSDNAYVYFTNDLTQISYYIPTGNGNSQLLQNQDISDYYDHVQTIIINDASDLITIFINSIKEGDLTIFNIAKNIWYKIRAYKLFTYIFMLSIGSIIVALVKGGARH